MFRKKERYGDVLRWAKEHMEPNEFQQLIDSKDNNQQAYMAALENLKTLKEKMEKPKTSSEPKKKKVKKKGTSFVKQKETRENQIKNYIAVMRKKHDQYTTQIVPLEVALEEEGQKLQKMESDIEASARRAVSLENKRDELLEHAKYVCKTYPSVLLQAKTLLEACADNEDKVAIQNDYDQMMKELTEQRLVKSKLDGRWAKMKEGVKVTFKTFFMGSQNRTVMQEIKLSAGGYSS